MLLYDAEIIFVMFVAVAVFLTLFVLFKMLIKE